MPSPSDTRRVWFTGRALGLHLTLVVVVPLFLGLFWWQVQRVRQGNTLSWAYVFEWPFFTCYAVYLWWKLVHDQPDKSAAPAPGDRGRSDGAASDPSAVPDSDLSALPASDLSALTAPTGSPASVVKTHTVAAEPAPSVTAPCEPAPSVTAPSELAAAVPVSSVPAATATEEEEDEELAAYNRYLAELNATGRPKRW